MSSPSNSSDETKSTDELTTELGRIQRHLRRLKKRKEKILWELDRTDAPLGEADTQESD